MKPLKFKKTNGKIGYITATDNILLCANLKCKKDKQTENQEVELLEGTLLDELEEDADPYEDGET